MSEIIEITQLDGNLSYPPRYEFEIRMSDGSSQIICYNSEQLGRFVLSGVKVNFLNVNLATYYGIPISNK